MEDWSVCRLCLESTEDSMKFLSSITSEQTSFPKMYFDLVGLKFIEYPSLPGQICKPCEEILVNAYKFRQKCIETEKKLENLLGSNGEKTIVHEPEEPAENNVHIQIVAIEPLAPEPDLENRSIRCKRCKEIVIGITLFKKHKCPRKNQGGPPGGSAAKLRVVTNLSSSDTSWDANATGEMVLERQTDNNDKKKPSQSKIWKCEICKKFYRSKLSFTQHMDKHTNFKRLECSHCEERFSDPVERRTHIYREHLKMAFCKCHICGKEYNTKAALRSHLNKHARNKEYQCPECGEKCSTASTLRAHQNTHLDIQDRRCEYCGKVFPYMKDFVLHIRTEHKEKAVYVCPKCSGEFLCELLLKRHMDMVHSGNAKASDEEENQVAEEEGSLPKDQDEIIHNDKDIEKSVEEEEGNLREE
ncbi:hypothetical protein DMENIID0001_067970 [Sergentomyia squamirostris]